MIGYEPIVEKMVIVDGQDFTHRFNADADGFPTGTELTLKIYSRDGDQLGAWPALTVDETYADVQITADDLEPIPDASTFRVYVQYPDTTDLVWYRGRVWRRV